MYQTGQQVVYGIHGVCQITDIELKLIDRKKIPYYVLEPLDQPGARYYVPTEKPAAVAKMSPLLTASELDALLAEREASGKAWVSDENQRKLRYRELISSGDRNALLAMVCALYSHKKQQAEMGKKFHLCDENFLRDAEKLLASEIAVVLAMTPEQAIRYLREQLQV